MIIRRQALLALSALSLARHARSQSDGWPSQPVRLVVPFPAGTAPDVAARAVAPSIGALLGATVFIDNRPGASTTIGTEFVARSTPDGYTLLLTATGAPALFPAIMKLRYDAVKDLPPLAMIARSEPVFLTGSQRKFGSLKDLVAWAKANPGKGSIGAVGIGTTSHLLCELLKRAAGIDLVYVPFSGGPQALQAMISGDIDLLTVDVGAILGQLGGGRIAPLATATRARSQFLPDVPTLIEAGFGDLVLTNNWALFTPAGVPAPVFAKLQAATIGAVNNPATRDALQRVGLIAQSSTADELAALIRQDAALLVPLARDLKIRLE